MTYEEFQERKKLINKAQDMFPDERNVTIAVRLYEQATGEVIGMLNTKEHGHRKPTVMDDYERIPCEVCGADMMFRNLQENEEGFHSQLVCSNPQCDTILNSEFTLQEWMEVLKKVI
jgi:hypothetical protein